MNTLRLRTLAIFTLLFGLLTAGRAEQTAPTRVFVCAHSFMIFTSKLLPPVAQAAGFPYSAAGQQMLGGSRVLQHWNLPDDRNVAKAALREGRVDVLTLSPHRLLPDEGIDNFTRLGLEKNPNLRVIVQASWPGFDGVWTGQFRNEQRDAATLGSLAEMRKGFRDLWLNAMEAQVRALNQSVGREAVHILPVFDAVFALRERIAKGTAPGLTKQTDLFRDDIGHPREALAALVTYCHFAAISGRSPVGLPVPAELQRLPHAVELNTLLEQLAWDAVTSYPLSGVKVEAAAGK
jgi:hypothetical protein